MTTSNPNTLIDLVREVGRISAERCDPACMELLHRQDAASVLGILIDHPHLLDQLNRSAGVIRSGAER